jgi:hypothetical protein
VPILDMFGILKWVKRPDNIFVLSGIYFKNYNFPSNKMFQRCDEVIAPYK